MDYRKFYDALFAPLSAISGSLDKATMMAIIGFDCGGPLNFCTRGREQGANPITYVSCELAVRVEQKPASFGRYELLCTCDSEKWVRSIVTDIGRMSLDASFDHFHTMDIASWVEPDAKLQGILFEKMYEVQIDRENYGVLRCIGITRAEMAYKQAHSAQELVARLTEAGVYPSTIINRKSVV